MIILNHQILTARVKNLEAQKNLRKKLNVVNERLYIFALGFIFVWPLHQFIKLSFLLTVITETSPSFRKEKC